MKLSDYKGTYEYFSGKLSDICRSLSFMGFGVVWILIGGIENLEPNKIPQSIKLVLGGLVLTLIMDVIHYAYQTIVWYWYFRKLEKFHGALCTYEHTAPLWITRIGWLMFWLKIILMSASYITLLIFIAKLIF